MIRNYLVTLLSTDDLLECNGQNNTYIIKNNFVVKDSPTIMAYLCDNELLDIYLEGYLTVETTHFLGLVDISFKVF